MVLWVVVLVVWIWEEWEDWEEWISLYVNFLLVGFLDSVVGLCSILIVSTFDASLQKFGGGGFGDGAMGDDFEESDDEGMSQKLL